MILEVTYTVQFKAKVDVGEHPAVNFSDDMAKLVDLFEDQINDIDIPEGGNHGSVYVPDTFEVDEVRVESLT